MGRLPKIKKKTAGLVLLVLVLILLAAGFLFHVLPAPDTLGHYIEPKATPAKPPLLAGAAAGLATRMNLPLIADATGSPDTDYSPHTIRFFDLSRGNPRAWHWDFGDGTSSEDQNPVHEYREKGEYNVSLLLTRDDGSRRAVGISDILGTGKPAGQQVRVDTLRQALVMKGSSVTFLAGDGSSFCTFDGSPRQLTEGSLVKLRVNTDDTGMVGIRQGNLYRFDFSDATMFVDGTQAAQGVSGDCILPGARYFHANLSYVIIPTEGSIREIVIGGENVRSGIENSRILITHDSSDKNADLTLVTNPAFFEGLADTFSVSPAVIAKFSVSQPEGPAPLRVSFRDLSAGSPESWLWDFGDGTSSAEQNPVHQYNSPGSYTVSLTARNDDQTDTQVQQNAVVALPPRVIADFTAFPLSGPAPLKVKFTDKSTGSPWQWSWGVMTNGTFNSSTGSSVNLSEVLHVQNPVVEFNDPGVYSVWMSAGNVYGSSEVVRNQLITVTDPYRLPTVALTLKTGKKGHITKDSSIQFVIGDSPATIGINGGYRELSKGSLIRIIAQSDQAGEIYMDKGQLLTFRFPDMAVFINGDLVAAGSIDSIYVPHPADFRTGLTYYLPPASAYTSVTMNGFDVLGDLETAWIRVENLGMDAGGNLRLTTTENTTYISGAANQTIHDWVVE
jgi:PKD repeat protein